MSESVVLDSRRPYRLRNYLPVPFKVFGSGIYAIINRNNFKVYIGSAVRLNHRWTEHRCSLEDGEHHSRYLQRAFSKDPEAFYIELIEEIPNASKAQILEREQFWMNFYRSFDPDFGYNISPTADSCQGIKRDAALCQRISNTLKGRKMSPERLAVHKRAMRGHKGRTFTPEQRLQQSRKFKGRRMPHGWAERISAMHRASPPVSKPVLQFDLTGKFIARFLTIVAAEEQFGGRSNIHSVCKGKRRTALGFMWRYESEFPSVDSIAPVRARKPKPKKHG